MRYTRLPLGLFAVCCVLSVTTAQTNQQTAAAAPLIVRGEIPAALTLTVEDLLRMPRETVSVADQDGIKVNYEGVNLREIMKRAAVLSAKELRGKALASYVLAKARDGYQVVFSLGELDAAFGNESILIAYKRDGKPLLGYEGPFRLVFPNDKAGARSVRMLDTLEVVRLQK